MPVADIQAKLPAGLKADIFDGWAWLGVVPFAMERVRFRTVGEHSLSVPSGTAFPELNLRTYVLGPDGRPGVYFYSLDAGSLLAVVGARVGFGLPYFWAKMSEAVSADGVRYTSKRLLTSTDVRFAATFRSLGTPSPEDDLRHFLTERYALYTRRFGLVQMGEIHHRPWRLEAAEAEIECNDLPGSFGLTLPRRAPVLHYSPQIEMEAWLPQRVTGNNPTG